MVHAKYRRTLKVNPKNIETGVTLPDCLLVAFYWEAIGMMGTAQVSHIEDLTGRDKAVIGLMAVAFDLSDVEFEAICRKLTPNQVEKAQVFRAKWVEAARREPKMAEIRHDVRERSLAKVEERSARIKTVQALHQEPDVAVAYAAGCRQLQSGQLLGAAGQTLYFLLPYGVLRARAASSGLPPVWANAPAHTSLTPQEKAVVRHLHKLLARLGDLEAQFDMTTGRTQIETETGLFPELAGAFAGHPISPEKLPFGNSRSPHWPGDAALPNSFPSLFDAVLGMHQNWNGPRPDDNLKDGH